MPCLNHSNYIWQRVQFMNLIITQFPPASHYFILLGSDILLSNPFLNTNSLHFPPNTSDHVLHVYKNRGKISFTFDKAHIPITNMQGCIIIKGNANWFCSMQCPFHTTVTLAFLWHTIFARLRDSSFSGIIIISMPREKLTQRTLKLAACSSGTLCLVINWGDFSFWML
jgi:hypothetical protein